VLALSAAACECDADEQIARTYTQLLSLQAKTAQTAILRFVLKVSLYF